VSRRLDNYLFGVWLSVTVPFVVYCGCECATTYRVHVLDGAEAELRHAILERDTHIMDLEQVGRKLVADYGQKIAWQAVLKIWQEQTGGVSLDRARDVIWLSQQGAHVQCVAWLIQFKAQWIE